MIAIMISLGTWQVHRLAWKTELLATIAARMNGDPVPLPADVGNPDDWAFKRVTLDGHFDAAHALWLYGRTYDGKAGIHLLVPLIRTQGDAVLVDRGFVPIETASQLTPFAPADGPATVDGVVRLPEAGGWFVPSNQPDKNVWYTVDMAAMAKATGLALAPVYVAQRATGAPGWPAATGGTEGAGIRNEHLQYAIFWYSMAVVLAGIYLVSSWKRVPR
jgi:surfeit locus 1 family protein